jgi:hypothetical protein
MTDDLEMYGFAALIAQLVLGRRHHDDQDKHIEALALILVHAATMSRFCEDEVRQFARVAERATQIFNQERDEFDRAVAELHQPF